MTHPEHDHGGLKPTIGRRMVRHPRQVVGVIGLAAALGAGAYILTDQLTPDPREPTAAVEPRQVAIEPPSGSPIGAPATSTDPRDGTISSSPVPTSAAASSLPVSPAPSPGSVAQRLADARSANTRLGTAVRPAVPPKAGGYVVNAAQTKVVESGSLKKDGRMLRVVSAPLDLAGQRELAWVGDDGKPYRGARCSQTIQMSNNVVPKARPTLLICWRTSAERSAYTVLVDLRKKPSKDDSIAALDRAWNKLG